MLGFRRLPKVQGGAVMQDPVEFREDSDLAAHERTYEAFNVLLRWSMVALGSGMLFLTMWFASAAGFFGALFTGIVVFVLGYYFLIRQENREPPLDVWSTDR
jgi:hypothetical protein